VYPKKFARRMAKLSSARSAGQKMKALKGFSPRELIPQAPANAEPRTGLSMGRHCERMAREWGIRREDQDRLALESHMNAARAYDNGFFDPLVSPWSGVSRDNNLRPDSSIEQLAALRTAFSKSADATLTAGNSTGLTDGAAAVLLASEDWASSNGIQPQAYLTGGRTSSVDFVNDEGLLMAPTIAVAELLQKHGLQLGDFDFYEIHEAFAAQVLCTLAAWESESYCRNRLGLPAPLGSIDRQRMNTRGSSLAVGHPFAATGARILGTLAQILEQSGSGRGLISICTAGGMGVAAILERP
jgi:acetyl-CoA C-acetyltransferase